MPLIKEVQDQLTSLNMKHAAEVLGELLEKAQKEDWSILKTLNILLAEERGNRADKAKVKRLKDAGFPYMATIEKFDFGFQTSISKKHMLQLMELSWLESAFNILFIGPPSVGKTHLAVSLGIAAVNAGYKVMFIHMECK
jgi:DNA replication protein DnaC